jgi:hypothetical protein
MGPKGRPFGEIAAERKVRPGRADQDGATAGAQRLTCRSPELRVEFAIDPVLRRIVEDDMTDRALLLEAHELLRGRHGEPYSSSERS